ncbi:MAG: hypothetical protein K5675_11050 [Lachnospiraceae bacterium]|nr:hypothetical protein [Lachnospiraceae bacterium]
MKKESIIMSESRIQIEANQIVEAAKTQMKDVMLEQPEHGMAYRFSKGPTGDTWIYEDGFHKFFRFKEQVALS